MDEQPARLRAVDLNITGWTTPKGELLLLNLGTKEEPKNVKINAKLDHSMTREAEQLLNLVREGILRIGFRIENIVLYLQHI